MSKYNKAQKADYSTNLEWTNQDEFKKHIDELRRQFGDQIPAKAAFDFNFEFNHGLAHTRKK